MVDSTFCCMYQSGNLIPLYINIFPLCILGHCIPSQNILSAFMFILKWVGQPEFYLQDGGWAGHFLQSFNDPGR